MMNFEPSNALQLHVKLLDIRPEIWRRLIVPTKCHLGHLHQIIQATFRWCDYHLHEFQIGGLRFGDLTVDETIDPDGPTLFDETTIRLSNLDWHYAPSLNYLYDFGDKWRHDITCEKFLRLDPVPDAATCVDGARARPPEDVGGPTGYADFRRTIANPNSHNYKAMKLWCGGHFDPNWFDLQLINKDVQNALTGKRRIRRHQPVRRQ